MRTGKTGAEKQNVLKRARIGADRPTDCTEVLLACMIRVDSSWVHGQARPVYHSSLTPRTDLSYTPVALSGRPCCFWKALSS